MRKADKKTELLTDSYICHRVKIFMSRKIDVYQYIGICFSLIILLALAIGFSFLLSPKQLFSHFSDLQLDWLTKSFYTFLILQAISLLGIFLINNYIYRTVILCLSCAFPFLLYYLIPYSLPILLLSWAATMLIAGTFLKGSSQVFSMLWILCVNSLGYMIHIPESFLNPSGKILSSFEYTTCILIIFILGLSTAFTQYTRTLFVTTREKWMHENQTNKQLSSFNTKLQAFTKQAKLESAMNERSRITREMHDSNGYAFTNIMALMNAAISSGNQEWSIIESILSTTWKQAHQGLQDSRKTLRALRSKLDEGYTLTIHQSVTEISQIFKECTGTSIIIHWGNMKPTYGSRINKIISRIIQESLVNSVRHGRATEVKVFFWERNGTFTLSIEDNGLGSTHVVKGIGLTGMEERVAPYNGKVEFSNNIEGGFKLMITLALPPEEIDKDGSLND